MKPIRLAVISDIHAGDERSESTHVRTEPPAARNNRHPLNDLRHLIEKNTLRADYLIAPGDLANMADPNGLNYAWRQLHGLAVQLKARLLSAPGNHDVITHDSVTDPRHMLKSLLPTFPTGNVDIDNHFWEHGWCSIEEVDHRIVIIDSTSGFPSFPAGATKRSRKWKDYKRDIDRGSLAESVERALEAYVSNLVDKKANIAIIHHHPQEHQLRDYLQDGYGPMYRGSELLDIFTGHPRGGRWVIIHGHKHVPQLANAIKRVEQRPTGPVCRKCGCRAVDPGKYRHAQSVSYFVSI
jgi:Calcineurin-like phosphoesterase